MQCCVSVALQLWHALNVFHPAVILLLVANPHILKQKPFYVRRHLLMLSFVVATLEAEQSL